MMSPQKKRSKLSPSAESSGSKRKNDAELSPNKRMRVIKSEEEEIKAQRRKNFVAACEQVSCKSYFDYKSRFLLVYLPSCVSNSNCKHQEKSCVLLKQVPPYVEESFKIEIRNNMWYDALEVCHMSLCINPNQYLTAEVLKDVVEIILNAHDDDISEHRVEDIIEKSQQILALNFNIHPPCIVKILRNTYNKFLTSPMDPKAKTFSNRSEFESNKGVVKYCMNRLEYEISAESIDGPLVDKLENIPEDMKESVKGLHWQKEKFEIFELLDRKQRIDRLMAVLESIVELLQFDLAIWHSRYTNNLGRHIMRSHKPLMAYVLWSDNVLFTGAVTSNCRQILRIFSKLIHLQYPDHMLKIITIWLNTMIQTFYICETNSNSDYPNTSKYCSIFAKEFYKIVSEMPHDSIIKICEKIEPPFMQQAIGILHLKTLLSTEENCILKIFQVFLQDAHWKHYPPDDGEIKLSKKLFCKPKSFKRKLIYLFKKCKLDHEIVQTDHYDKWVEKRFEITNASLRHVIHIIYVTLDAYLDMFNVQQVQESWMNLNEQSQSNQSAIIDESILLKHSSYSVTETFIKKYRYILQAIKELGRLLQSLKSNDELPDMLNIFINIGLLDIS